MSILGTVAAAATFYFTGSPQLAMTAYGIGAGVDAAINAPDIMGPRIEDLKVQMSTYGAPIPFEWGVNRHAGSIIWPRDLTAVETQHSESSKGGPSKVTFTYTVSCAVLVCEGPIAGIRRIWANKKIIYDVSSSNAGATQDRHIGSLRIYLGTESQAADPLIEATDGTSPAYLGYAYVVFEGYDTTDLGGRPPQWEFEVITDGVAISPRAPVYLGNSAPASPIYTEVQAVVDKNTGLIYSLSPYTVGPTMQVRVNSDITQTQIASFSIDASVTSRACCTGISSSESTRAYLFQTPDGVMLAASTAFYDMDALYTFSSNGLSVSGPIIPWRYETCTCPPDEVAHREIIATRHGTSYMTVTMYNTVTDRIMIFRAGGYVGLVNPGTHQQQVFNSFQIGDGYGSLGTVWVSQVLITPLYFAAFYYGTTTGVILRRLSDYGFHAQFDCYNISPGSGTAFYDNDRGRIIVSKNGSVPPFSYQIIDIAAGTIANHTFIAAVGADTSPAPSNAVITSAYYEGKYIFGANATSGYGTTLYMVNPRTLATDYTHTYEAFDALVPFLMADPLLRPVGEKPYIFSFDQARVKRLYLAGRLDPKQVLLSTIVSDICLREGLVAGDIDVTQLTDLVDGYIVPRQMTGRAAIEPLQTAYYFDAVESDDKIKFVKRGAVPAVTIPQDDRAAHEHGQAMPDALSIVRAFELELPYQCDVEYPDVNADHLIGNQYDRRITKATKRKINLQLPIVMTAAKAKEVARVNLYQAWLNQTYRWSTSRKYAKYEPTDVVNVPSDAANYSAMITAKREHPNGVIEWEGRMTAIEVYAQSGSDASPTNYAPQTVSNPVPTVLALLDMPLLRDEDDNAGFYVAMGGAL